LSTKVPNLVIIKQAASKEVNAIKKQNGFLAAWENGSNASN